MGKAEKPTFEQKTWPVLSYCAIPEKITETCNSLQETSNDVFVEYDITPKAKQAEYDDDDFTLDNWIIDNCPEMEGKKILIHIDY